MKLKLIITLIFTFWSNITIAACYIDGNDNHGTNIKGLHIIFSNEDSCPDHKAPYILITPEGSNIKTTQELKFTISRLDSNFKQSGDKINLVSFYSDEHQIAEIFIYHDGSSAFIRSDPSNIIDEAFNEETEYVISSNKLQFSSISKIKFANTPKNENEYQFFGKIDDIKYGDLPIISSKPYRINYESYSPYNAQNRIKSPVKLKEGIKSENTVIYYDHTLDYDPETNKDGKLEPIKCKEGYSPGPINAGHYFRKDTKEIMFHGCCFKNTYTSKEKQDHSSLSLTKDITFDAKYSYSYNDINQMDLSTAKTELPSTNAIKCSSGTGYIISNNMASYYFDIDSCKMKLYGECTGDSKIHQSSMGAKQKLNYCSTIQIGHSFKDKNSGPKTIDCKNGCIHEDNSNLLSYSISNGVVEISGGKCIGETKSINKWLPASNNLPLGIDGRQNLQYVADNIENRTNIIGNIPCKAGYNGSVQYSFNNGNIEFHNESCVAKKYSLNDSPDSSLEGLNVNHTVHYHEFSPVTLNAGVCKTGYSPNNLKYYFIDGVGNSNPTLRIMGNCERNSCSATNINNNNPPNTLNISTLEITSNSNCRNNNGNISCAVNAEILLDCNRNNGYIASSNPPKKICQSDGNWSVSGSCIRNENYCGASPSVANADTSSISSGYLGQNITTNCNNGYDGTINLTCQSDGNWSVNDNNCTRHGCYHLGYNGAHWVWRYVVGELNRASCIAMDNCRRGGACYKWVGP
jgi:hypothetical protein